MKHIIGFIILFGIWLLFTFNLSTSNIITGGIASFITTLFFGKHFINPGWKIIHPHRYLWLLLYLIIFTWECIKANFDVAYRVLHPAMPIKPGIVKVKLNLKTNIAKSILANSITMTPGTISVDLVGDYLYVHWIYVSSFDPETYSRKVAGRFEYYLRKIFE